MANRSGDWLFDVSVLRVAELEALAAWAPTWCAALAGGRVLLAR